MRLGLLVAAVGAFVAAIAAMFMTPKPKAWELATVRPGADYLELAVQKIQRIAHKRKIDIIDATRSFVYENSSHGNGKWWAENANNYPMVIEGLYRTSIGDGSATKPELLCGNHATAMAWLLDKAGIKNFRFIRAGGTYHVAPTPFQDHVMLEVRNPETREWELHDPNYGVYYVDNTGDTASVKDIAFVESLKMDIRPCGELGCSWFMNPRAADLLYGGYYAAFEIQGRGRVYINKKRFDPKKRYALPSGDLPFDQAFLTSVTQAATPLNVTEIR